MKNISIKQYFLSAFVLFFLFPLHVFSMNLAPKGSCVLDKVMFDYYIPLLVLGVFGFVFVIFGIFGSERGDSWRKFCVFYFSLFVFLFVNFICWWMLRRFSIPRRELYAIVVFIATSVVVVFAGIGNTLMKRPKKNPSKTWVCPHCGKVNTFTLTCYDCSEPRVVGKKK